MYENPTHNAEERGNAWEQIFAEFSESVTDWSGLEPYRRYAWQRQLHIYEVPFYYIEYGIAQLGAIAIWKKYRENKTAGLKGYLDALRLGYTATIPEIYNTAQIPFDFSKDYIAELMNFVKSELESL